MKQAGEIAASVSESRKPSIRGTNPGRLDSDEATELVNRVFQVFKAHWPRRFPSIWPTDDALVRSKRAWHIKFSKSPWLTQETLQAGLARVTDLDWPPDNPGEFLKLCHRTPDMVGAPDEVAAFHEACRGAHPGNVRQHRWSHKAVYAAAVRTGLQAILHRPNQNEKRFYRNYQEALDQFEELEDPPAAELPYYPPEPGPETDEVQEQEVAKMREMLS